MTACIVNNCWAQAADIIIMQFNKKTKKCRSIEKFKWPRFKINATIINKKHSKLALVPIMFKLTWWLKSTVAIATILHCKTGVLRQHTKQHTWRDSTFFARGQLPHVFKCGETTHVNQHMCRITTPDTRVAGCHVWKKWSHATCVALCVDCVLLYHTCVDLTHLFYNEEINSFQAKIALKLILFTKNQAKLVKSNIMNEHCNENFL